jgi:CHASE2 domain-containing sensor protein
MVKRVVLQIGDGSFDQGFPVTLQIGEEGAQATTSASGKLPGNPEIECLYKTWQALYTRLGGNLRLGARAIQGENLSVLKSKCHKIAQDLQIEFKTWLQAQEFRPICDRWLKTLTSADEIHAILQTENSILQKLPWHLWEILDQYSQAEMALSTPTFHPPAQFKPRNRRVKILAIIGMDADDALTLKKLPDADVEVLHKPQRAQLNDKLWEQVWDILFFAGHSYSWGKNETGVMVINETDTLTIEEVRYALRKAIASGLKLAIFNSCQGLGIARGLADLNIPQTIVMREPVPNYVAGKFLEYFLPTFAQGESLYLSVRSAREKLHGQEDDFVCATWLPVIYQNPAEIPCTWENMKRPKSNWILPLTASLLATAVVLGVRHVGLLQPWELKAYDAMLQARSLVQREEADDRILVIKIGDKDVAFQEAKGERMDGHSISHASLEKLIKILAKYQPRAIGLDLQRNNETAPPSLTQQFAQVPNVIGACKTGDLKIDPYGIAPPHGIPKDRVGFTDGMEDLDKISRRQLIFNEQPKGSPCPNNAYSFSMTLALRYLSSHGIKRQNTSSGHLQLEHVVFSTLDTTPGGYHQTSDLRGHQILLNYRPAGVPSVGLTEILQNPEKYAAKLRGRIVVVGVTRPDRDVWLMPFLEAGQPKKEYGVFLQAQEISQILSAVLNQRPLIHLWNRWAEVVWIGGWILLTSLLCWRVQSPLYQIILIPIIIGGLVGLCFVLFVSQAAWVPVIPAVIGIFLASSSIVLHQTSRRQHLKKTHSER